MAYPTALELAEFCVDAKLIEGFPVDYTSYEMAITSSIALWEQQTGWPTFLAPEEDVDKVYRQFSPGLLDFRGGFVEITSVTLDDDAEPLTEHTDYSVIPDASLPIRMLKLYRRPAQKITVIGKPGYCSVVPAGVKRAILADGAAQIATLLNGTGQLIEVKQGDVGYKYAEGSSVNPTTQYAQWQRLFKSAVSRYTRRSFV